MSDAKPARPGDAKLGMDEPITRRDFLGSVLLASGAALLESRSPAELAADNFTGYGGDGEYSTSNGNTFEVMQAGQSIRYGTYDPLPKDLIDTGETYDCVVIGGGISGLAAALFFTRQTPAGTRCLVLENHPIFGGEAKQNEFLVDGKRLITHQGSAIFQLQYPHSFLEHFYESIGLQSPRLEYQEWAGPGPEMILSRTPYQATGLQHGQYGYWFGAKFQRNPGSWLIDPIGTELKGAPVSPATRAELLRWLKAKPVEGDNFVRPLVEGDASSRYLDSITLEQHYMERFGLSRETVRTFLSPVEGGGSGLGPDALSAFCDYAFEMVHPLPDPAGETDQMFPGGNATIARLLLKSLIPSGIDGPHTIEGVTQNTVNFAALDTAQTAARVRLSSTVVAVQHEGAPSQAEFVNIVYLKAGKLYRVKARSVVVAGGSWTTKQIIKDLPETHRKAYAQFYRSPCMMANVALRNWRFLYKMGVSGCQWFEGLGSFAAIRKLPTFSSDDKTITPDSPVVLTLKVIFPHYGLPLQEQGNLGRAQLLTTSFRDYERQIRAQMTEMFSASGFDATRDIAGIVLNRWGHAYVSPQPGFFFGKDGNPAPRTILRAAPFGRIAFANTDLSGTPDHRTAIGEAHRAVSQLLDQVLI